MNPLRTAAFLLCLAAHLACAEELPLWEGGAGIGAASIPHYRGSDQTRAWVLPVPYFVYRGETLKIEERRLRGLFFDSDKVELDFSLNGSPPAKGNDARRGMPDLDATLEIGPSINFSVFQSKNGMEKLELRLPARTVIASDFSHFKNVGWIFQPNFSLDVRDVLGNRGWSLGLQGGLIYADRRYNQYFYAVDPVFAAADRPAFSPSGGYAGTTLLTALSKRFPGFWVGGFAKWDNVADAVYADSPLIKAKNNFTAGFGVAWILGSSAARIAARD